MGRYLIEVPHPADPKKCTAVVKAFLSSGSRLVTNADWGCLDDVHNAWLIVDVDSREEAAMIVPPALRAGAKVTSLNAFSMDYIEAEIKRLSK